jgi:hypothetical protein
MAGQIGVRLRCGGRSYIDPSHGTIGIDTAGFDQPRWHIEASATGHTASTETWLRPASAMCRDRLFAIQARNASTPHGRAMMSLGTER